MLPLILFICGLASAGRRGGGVSESRVGCCPDGRDGAASTDEQSCRRKDYECQQKGVLDQILTLFVLYQLEKKLFH